MSISVDLNNLLYNLSVATLVIDSHYRVQYANHAAQALFEQSHKQMLNQLITALLADTTIACERFKQTFSTGEGFTESDARMTLCDGRSIKVDMTATRLEDQPNKLLLLEIKQIDQQKRISDDNHRWAQLQASRELIRGLAHEIKNPLGGIRGAAQLLEKELDSPDKVEFTQMIVEQTDRLRALVDRLLGPNALPNFKWCNIHAVLEKVSTLVSMDLSHDIEVVRDYDPSIPDVYIDEDMIHQAVLNIVRNAIQVLKDADYQGQIQLVTRVERQMTIHGQKYPLCAQVRIIDNGAGIPVDLKDTLFYPMVTGKKEGTGLGLSIAQTLVNHHQGKIEVDSWPGYTEFCLYLPIEKRNQDT